MFYHKQANCRIWFLLHLVDGCAEIVGSTITPGSSLVGVARPKETNIGLDIRNKFLLT